MDKLQYRFEENGDIVEYEIFPNGLEEESISENDQFYEIFLSENQSQIDLLNEKIDNLTDHSDKIDKCIAICSGLLAGIVDVVFVGDFSLDVANNWGKKSVDDIVLKISNKFGYKGDSLEGAVSFLEKKYSIAADKATDIFGGGLQHHLRDFSHHPTPIGLLFSLLTQFTIPHMVFGTDTAGVFHAYPLKIKVNGEYADITEDGVLIGKNIYEKIVFGVFNWCLHLVSDMDGSSGSIGLGKEGTGIPGPICSLLKEISALPFFNKLNSNDKRELSEFVSKLFNGTLLGERNENGKLIKARKFDLRTEIGIAEELGKQAIPVIVNECIVRTFYFIRRLGIEIKEKNIKNINELSLIDWEKIAPFNNRTITRMLTFATGSMEVVDITDAAIRGAIEAGKAGSAGAAAGGAVGGGYGAAGGAATAGTIAFWKTFAMRINYIGVARFAVAGFVDIKQGEKKESYRNERISLTNERINLYNTKLCYKEVNLLETAEETGNSITETLQLIEQNIGEISESLIKTRESLINISEEKDLIDQKNPGLVENMLKTLKWG